MVPVARPRSVCDLLCRSGLFGVANAPWPSSEPVSPESLSRPSGVPCLVKSDPCIEPLGHAPGKNGVEDLRFGSRQRKGELDMEAVVVVAVVVVVKVKEDVRAWLQGCARFCARSRMTKKTVPCHLPFLE